MDQDQQEAETPLRDLQEELSSLKKLHESPVFQRLLDIAKVQIQSRQDTIILRPLENRDQILAQEYSKGECSGIKLFTQLPLTLMESLETEIAERLRQEEEANANSNKQTTES
jgi:hypothetical protein